MSLTLRGYLKSCHSKQNVLIFSYIFMEATVSELVRWDTVSVLANVEDTSVKDLMTAEAVHQDKWSSHLLLSIIDLVMAKKIKIRRLYVLEQSGNINCGTETSLCFECEELNIGAGRVTIVMFIPFVHHIKRHFPGKQILNGTDFEKYKESKEVN